MVACAMLASIAAAATTSQLLHAKPAARSSETITGHPAPARVRTGSAVVFLSKIIRLLAANDYARAWTSLDPRQQRLVPRASYVRCEIGSPIPGRLRRIVSVAARSERVLVPGGGRTASRSIAVTFRLTFDPLPGAEAAQVRVKAHAVLVRRRWAWMLPAERLELHRSGGCGASPPPGGPSL